jgi:two-component system sensor histidine kinase ChvG
LVRDTKATGGNAEVVLGEDWVSPQAAVDVEMRDQRKRRGIIAINRSPLARKIIIFNLLGLLVLVGGVLYLNPFRDSLLHQRERALVISAELVAEVFEARQGGPGGTGPLPLTPDLARGALDQIKIHDGGDIHVFGTDGALLGLSTAAARDPGLGVIGLDRDGQSTIITDLLSKAWDVIAGSIASSGRPEPAGIDTETQARAILADALAGRTRIAAATGANSDGAYVVTTPILVDGVVVGAIALASSGDQLDALVRGEREQILQMFVIAILVSIGLSLVLASTIANPLSDLAAAAELGRDKNARKVNPGRVRIPDLSARPDEIGRLSKALRGMVAALYDRIDANEQFAADVAHEIKNPLASLRSAIGTLRVAKKDEHRDKLLDVIDHDVRRLDRLVSDISNASRLDSELVKEEEETFDLLKMLRNLTEYLGNEAHQKGVDFITDLPAEPIRIQGLEARLAQVFVNLISNATSFCDEGDAIRVWARQRENRVLVVVEDTGPGIPEEALTKVFNRFYSQRPENQFGNNSGLGLAISKQIVEAHGGVIWAENIRPTDADITSEPLGARFVVGLPV